MRHLGDWIKAVGWWWTAAVGFLPSLFTLSGNIWIEENIGSPLPLATASLVVLLFGSFLAYRRVAMEKDQHLDESQPRFLIQCPHLPTTANNRLYLLDVYLVNRHQNHTLNLRFALGAPGEAEEIFAARAMGPTPPVYAQNQVIANPKHLDPGTNFIGYLAFEIPAGDITPLVMPGVHLLVIDEQTDVAVRVPLATPASGFHYPSPGQ